MKEQWRIALEAHRLREGLIVTAEESGTIEEDGRLIRIVPLHEWLRE